MRVPIFKRTAAILLLTLCVCAVSCRSEEPQPANPSGERLELPGQDAEPEEVLRSYLACLQCGDSVTYMKLFADKNAAWSFTPAFQGPQEIRNVLLEECEPGTDGERYWKVTYLARVDERGNWNPQGEQEEEICQYPCLIQTGKGWKIKTLQGRVS